MDITTSASMIQSSPAHHVSSSRQFWFMLQAFLILFPSSELLHFLQLNATPLVLVPERGVEFWLSTSVHNVLAFYLFFSFLGTSKPSNLSLVLDTEGAIGPNNTIPVFESHYELEIIFGAATLLY